MRAPCGVWLTCLDLNRNGLGEEGCRVLAGALNLLQSLEILQAIYMYIYIYIYRKIDR
jgi:hypothetical protein